MEKLENFRFFALKYLNDWCEYDSGFVAGLSPSKSRDERVRCIQNAASYYRIARNFRTLPEEKRLLKALQALDEIGGPIPPENVDQIVDGLAKKLRLNYGRSVISAASKLLWIRHQTPVVIYDRRAQRCLNRWYAAGIGESDYSKYYAEWRRQFADHEASIRSACDELVHAKEFTLAYDKTDEQLRQLVNKPWFRERVFDQFLWWNGDEKKSDRQKQMGKGYSKEQVKKMLLDAAEAEEEHPPLAAPRSAIEKLRKVDRLKKANGVSSSKDQ